MDTMTKSEAARPAAGAAARGAGWSALFDGECTGEELEALLAEDDVARREAVWDAYRCIGEALRAQEAAQPAAADPVFVRAVMARVQAEPHAPAAPRVQRRPDLPPAANAALWRWRAVAGVAALAAVVALLWPQLAPQGGEAAQLAVAPAPAAAVSAGAPVPVRDARLEELMAAHRSWGSASALNAPGGFLRTVAYEVPGR